MYQVCLFFACGILLICCFERFGVAKRCLLKRKNKEFHDPEAAVVTQLMRWPFDDALEMVAFRCVGTLQHGPASDTAVAQDSIVFAMAAGCFENQGGNVVGNRIKASRHRCTGSNPTLVAHLLALNALQLESIETFLKMRKSLHARNIQLALQRLLGGDDSLATAGKMCVCRARITRHPREMHAFLRCVLFL